VSGDAVRQALLAAIAEMWRWALWLGIASVAMATLGYGGIFQGVLAPLEGTPLIVLGQAGLAAALVLVVLALIARKAAGHIGAV